METFTGDLSGEKLLFRKANVMPPSLIFHESGWCQVSRVIGVKHGHLWPLTVTALQHHGVLPGVAVCPALCCWGSLGFLWNTARPRPLPELQQWCFTVQFLCVLRVGCCSCLWSLLPHLWREAQLVLHKLCTGSQTPFWCSSEISWNG